MSFDQLNLEGFTSKERALAMLDELYRMYCFYISQSDYEELYGAIDAIADREINDDEFYADTCYECGGYGDDYSIDENGELMCNCDTCWVTRRRNEAQVG